MAFFERIGAASDTLRSYVLGLDKKNISEHLHYSTYYTPELAELVLIRDRHLLERFVFSPLRTPFRKQIRRRVLIDRADATPVLGSLPERREGFKRGQGRFAHNVIHEGSNYAA